MTDNKNEKPRLTLKLNSEKINLNNQPSDVVRKNHIGSKTITVEVKKTRAPQKKSDNREELKKNLSSELNLTESELDLRMKVLQNAAQNNKKRELVEDFEENEDANLINEEVEEISIHEVSEQEEKHVQPQSQQVTKQSSIKETNKKLIQEANSKIPVKATEETEEKSASKKDPKAATKEKTEVKEKYTEIKGLRGNKVDVRYLSDSDEDDQPVRKRSMASIRRAREKAKRHEEANQKSNEKIIREVILPEFITVQELASRMAEKGADVIRELMKLGVMVTITQSIDADTAELVIMAFGHKVKRVQDSDVENVLIDAADEGEKLERRAPVVTVMGHVDHGKTSLLDALKSTDIASGEAGGITQHIGAYQVKVDDTHYVTFLDTPGHEAFSAMRSRGAKVTDIVVLVVAADDGIMAQTVEAINHAKAADVPIIVAINKIDKPDADSYRVRNELLSHSLVVEELGGDIMAVDVSARQRINLDKLIECILLQSEMMDLKANYDRPAAGVVIESKVDKGRGVVASLLVQKGTLKIGDIIVAGASFGKVRGIINDKAKQIECATPSMPVEVIGLADAPIAGDQFNIVSNEKQAREITDYRARKIREIKNGLMNRGTSLQDMFARASVEGKVKELPIIIKADVHGSVEAISATLGRISNEEVKVRVLHAAVGGITESDITLAKASNALILGFNVRASATARQMAEHERIDVRYYSIIYNLIDDIKACVSGMLSPIMREEYIGNAEIRQVFNVTKMGKIAGCYVTKGMIKRGAGVRLIRDNIVIHEGKLKTLKRFKDDVKEVKEGFECGVAFENYDDIRENDVIEAFEIIEERKVLN